MHDNTKNLTDVINEIKLDAKDFVSTRVQIFTTEMKEKLSAWKTGIPLLIGAAVCGGMAFLVLNYALVAFLAALFAPSPYSWCYGALIVGIFYTIVAAVLYWVGRREIQVEGVTPTRTLRVLKDDQIWLQKEARSQA